MTFRRGKIWWYEFWFAGRRTPESAKATSKTVAKLAEQKRRPELEEGFSSIEDRRDERIRTIKEVAKGYLEGYTLGIGARRSQSTRGALCPSAAPGPRLLTPRSGCPGTTARRWPLKYDESCLTERIDFTEAAIPLGNR